VVVEDYPSTMDDLSMDDGYCGDMEDGCDAIHVRSDRVWCGSGVGQEAREKKR